MEFKPGMIGFSARQNNLMSKMIRFFIGRFSHTFVTTLPFGGVPSLQEAELLIQVVPLTKYTNDKHNPFCLFEIAPEFASEEVINKALLECYEEYAGVTYGVLQLPWFMWAWLNKKIGRDISHSNNWFTRGVICSELVYYFLVKLGPEFKALVEEYNADVIQPVELYNILSAHPKMFKLVYSDFVGGGHAKTG